jgi:hypothetical protein
MSEGEERPRPKPWTRAVEERTAEIRQRRAACRVCGEPISRTGDQWWHDDPTLNDAGDGRVDHDAWPPRETPHVNERPTRR